jgi:hypothetical protein
MLENMVCPNVRLFNRLERITRAYRASVQTSKQAPFTSEIRESVNALLKVLGFRVLRFPPTGITHKMTLPP